MGVTEEKYADIKLYHEKLAELCKNDDPEIAMKALQEWGKSIRSLTPEIIYKKDESSISEIINKISPSELKKVEEIIDNSIHLGSKS